MTTAEFIDFWAKKALSEVYEKKGRRSFVIEMRCATLENTVRRRNVSI